MATAGDQTSSRQSDRIAGEAARTWMNPPNLLTFARFVLSFVLFGMIWWGGWWFSAALLFVVAVATDAADGYIARKYEMVTTLGRIFDPFVDKIIICGSFIFLLERSAESGVNAWMVVIVISRELLVTSLRGFLEQHGFDFSATFSGKFKMVLQSAAVLVSLLSLSPVLAEWSLLEVPFVTFRDVLLWAAVLSTIHSGGVYVLRAVTMLRSTGI